MRAPIAEWYQELIVRPIRAGEEGQVTEFVDRLLRGLTQWRRVEARRDGATRVVFRLGRDEVVVDDEIARATFRSVCARLAVVVGGADPPLYGTKEALEVVLPSSGGTGRLELMNTPSEQWFRIETDSARPS